MSEGGAGLADMLRVQGHYCRVIGSPLYAELLERAADDVLGGGPVAEALAGHEHDDPSSMLPLRLMGAVHRLVLAGEAPALARFYPSMGGEPDAERAWPAFRDTVAALAPRVREELDPPVQTNEVGRCGALLGAFMLVAREHGLPLRLLEVGASAGLNLNFDRYRYELGGASFGAEDSPVRFAGFVSEGTLPLAPALEVAERRGCDAAPLDPRSESDRLLLRSFVWPDQVERFQALDGALELAARHPVAVDHADAADWVERRLAQPTPGRATVVFHSLVMMYMNGETRGRMTAALEDAGRRATADAPLAWLRMELGGDEANVDLKTWPGGEDRRVARAHYHGHEVKWLAG
jgi:hypothetical protein